MISFLALSCFAAPDPGLAFILAHNPIGKAPDTKEPRGAGFDVTNEVTVYGMLLVRFYQLVLSPQTPPSCNFSPSCSQFGLMAIKKYGFFLGILMASDRLQRCNGRSLEHYPIYPPTGKRYDPPERNIP
jgi:putative membrane protein insertion efficiency factor